MFEKLKKQIKDKNESNSPQNMSFDFKLFFAYHIAMMILFGARPIEDPFCQAMFALALGGVLFVLSLTNKIKRNWSWPGLSISSIPTTIFNLVFLYLFFAFAAYSMNPKVGVPDFENTELTVLLQDSWAVMQHAFNQPVFTPWFLAGAGIMVFNILTNLKLVCLKKDEFEAQCNGS